MNDKDSENSQALSTFECINFIFVASGLCSAALVYAMLLGPLFLVVPWLLFYGLKKNSAYFRGWTWFRAAGVAVASYILGIGLGTLSLYVLMAGDSLLASGLLAVFIFGDLIYSSTVFGKRIFNSA